MSSSFNREQFLSNFQGLEKLIVEVVEEFLKHAPEMLSKIEKAIQNNNAKDLEISAHTFKGSVSNFFAEPVRNLAFELEKLGKNSQLNGAKEVFQKMTQEFELLCSDLRALQQEKRVG